MTETPFDPSRDRPVTTAPATVSNA
jgi:hypothetical protein